MLDHLNEQRRIVGLLEVPAEERETGNEGPVRLERARDSLSYEEPPSVMAVAKDESECVRKIRKLFLLDLAQD